MRNLKKILALVCAFSMMAAFTACGEKTDDAAQNATETAEVTTAEETEAAEEETEEETEAETEEETDELTSDESLENSDDVSASADGEFDAEGTIASMVYPYSTAWTEQEISGQTTYIFDDYTGMILVQNFDAASFPNAPESDDEMIELVADKCEEAWANLENMQLMNTEWVDDVISGKKCYAVTYTYSMSGITADTTSYFFANFDGDVKDVFAVSGCSLDESKNGQKVVLDVLKDVHFN